MFLNSDFRPRHSTKERPFKSFLVSAFFNLSVHMSDIGSISNFFGDTRTLSIYCVCAMRNHAYKPVFAFVKDRSIKRITVYIEKILWLEINVESQSEKQNRLIYSNNPRISSDALHPLSRCISLRYPIQAQHTCNQTTYNKYR